MKHFGWESLNVQNSCCLDVVVVEFKSRGSDSNAQRYHP